MPVLLIFNGVNYQPYTATMIWILQALTGHRILLPGAVGSHSRRRPLLLCCHCSTRRLRTFCTDMWVRWMSASHALDCRRTSYNPVKPGHLESDKLAGACMSLFATVLHEASFQGQQKYTQVCNKNAIAIASAINAPPTLRASPCKPCSPYAVSSSVWSMLETTSLQPRFMLMPAVAAHQDPVGALQALAAESRMQSLAVQQVAWSTLHQVRPVSSFEIADSHAEESTQIRLSTLPDDDSLWKRLLIPWSMNSICLKRSTCQGSARPSSRKSSEGLQCLWHCLSWAFSHLCHTLYLLQSTTINAEAGIVDCTHLCMNSKQHLWSSRDLERLTPSEKEGWNIG